MNIAALSDGGATPAVEASDISVCYRRGRSELRALDGVSLLVPQRQFVCMMGRSGSGKSSLLHVLAALRTPSSGHVRIGGREVHALSDRDATVFRRRHIGLVFQFFNLVPTLDVERNIGLPLRADGVAPARIRERMQPLLEALELEARLEHYPNELSGGEMQRVAIARALVGDPALVLADEPTGNLDSVAAERVLRKLRELCDARGVSVIVMTHDPAVAAYADRVMRLRDGRVEHDAKALREDARDGDG